MVLPVIGAEDLCVYIYVRYYVLLGSAMVPMVSGGSAVLVLLWSVMHIRGDG